MTTAFCWVFEVKRRYWQEATISMEDAYGVVENSSDHVGGLYPCNHVPAECNSNRAERITVRFAPQCDDDYGIEDGDKESSLQEGEEL
jgi:hypothetical protein